MYDVNHKPTKMFRLLTVTLNISFLLKAAWLKWSSDQTNLGISITLHTSKY